MLVMEVEVKLELKVGRWSISSSFLDKLLEDVGEDADVDFEVGDLFDIDFDI